MLAHRELSSCELFAGIDALLLDQCLSSAEQVLLQRGEILMREGEPADSICIVLDGSVEVLVERGVQEPELVDVLGRGACVGDLAVLLGRPRTATVRALRDSRVVRVSADTFHGLISRSPEVAVRLARMLGERLQQTTHRRERTRPIRAIAVVGISPAADSYSFCEDLRSSFGSDAKSIGLLCRSDFELDGAAQAAGFGADPGDWFRRWFSTQEERYQCILYECDPDASEWTRQCLRQADYVIMVAHDRALPSPERTAILQRLATEREPRPRIDLAILHDTGPPYRGTHQWLRTGNFSSWHHLRVGSAADYGRLGRRIRGRAHGVVLGGGGARGFAHIGVLKALEEVNLPIDCVSGTSMGAIVGAQYAAGCDIPTMIELNRRAFCNRRVLPDITIPYVAILDGRHTTRMLKAMFGELRIEDLPIPYFCVSSNLSRAESVVHERGRLWLWTRASCAIPGLVPPVRYRGDLLVDGALLDNLPVEEMRARCRGKVIAADVSVSVDFRDASRARRSATMRGRRFCKWLRPPQGMPSIGQILARTVSLSSVRDARMSEIPADLYFHPAVDEISLTDFAKIDEIVALGTEHARARLAAWLMEVDHASTMGGGG
jgi:predicted acylesterase/phospholipase RssA/CRP-like cAMP-binding protein